MSLVAELEDIRRQTFAVEDEIQTLVKDLDEEHVTWRPGPKAWSITEVLVHLRLTVDRCLPALDEAVADARRRGLLSGGPFNVGWKGRFFVWYVEPPPKIRLPAPKTLATLPTMTSGEAIAAWREGHRLVLDRVERANGVDLVAATFQSPFAAFVRMNLLALFRVFTAHERRHAWQIARIRERLR